MSILPVQFTYSMQFLAYTPAATWGGATMVKSRIIREIIHRYREEGIEFAFPSMSLYPVDSNVKIG